MNMKVFLREISLADCVLITGFISTHPGLYETLFCPAGGCPPINPPVDNSSCDPPCLMPKSFCSEVSSSLFSYPTSLLANKEQADFYTGNIDEENISSEKNKKNKSTGPLDERLSDTLLPDWNLSPAGNNTMAAMKM